jgi:hypothetical protein
MRTITLELTELDLVLEKGEYENKKGEIKNISKNTIYSFKTKGIDFNIKLYKDEKNIINIVSINNIDLKYQITNRRNFYLILMRDFGFLPSFRQFNNISDNILFKPERLNLFNENSNIDFNSLFYINEDIYLVDFSKNAKKAQFTNNYVEEPYYDYILKISKEDILDIDTKLIGEYHYIFIYTKRGCLRVKENTFEIEETLDCISSIKQNILIRKNLCQ